MRRIWERAAGSDPFASGVLLTTGTNVSIMAAGVATSVLSARLLGPEGRGALAAIQLWAGLGATVALLGIPEALAYFSAREPDAGGRYAGSAAGTMLVLSMGFVAITYVAMPNLLAAQPPPVVAAARWYLGLVPLMAVLSVPAFWFWGRGAFRVWNALRLLPPAGWLGVLLFAWVVGRATAPFISAVHLGWLTIQVPIFFLALRRGLGSFRFEVGAVRRLARYGVASWAATIPQLLKLRLGSIFLAALFAEPVLGAYAVALAYGGAALPLLNGVASAVFPAVAGQEHRDLQVRTLTQGSRLAVGVALAASVALIVVAYPGIPWIFGSGFRAAVPAAIALVVASAIGGMSLVLVQGFRGLGHPADPIAAGVLGLVAMTGTLITLVRPWGALGAAVAMIVGAAVEAAVLVARLQTVTGLPGHLFLLPSLGELKAFRAHLRAWLSTSAPPPA